MNTVNVHLIFFGKLYKIAQNTFYLVKLSDRKIIGTLINL